ncbi:MAG TPA: peptide-binding protein [Planctomycetota bacterium]|nr:peptide-binding protein [Planctomycetota bacterium]
MRTTVRRSLWVLLAGVVLVGLLGLLLVSQRPRGRGSAPGPWLIMRIQEPGGTLNPIISKDYYAGAVNGYVYESFLRRDPITLKWVPNLAESLPEISPDKKQFTFRLRKGILWHPDDNELTPDNVEITADDVIFSHHTIMNPKVECQNIRNYFQDLEKVEKLDRYTVRFTAKNVYWRWISVLGSMDIVPKHIFEYPEKNPELFNINPAGRHPIGTGPYRFLTWDHGQQIILVRNEVYWNKERMPKIPRIVFKFIIDDTAAMEHVKKQEIDRFGCSSEQWFRDAAEPMVLDHFRRFRINSIGYNYIGWNQKTVFFKDRLVRLAMTHAVPRQRFLETRMNNLGRVVTGNFYVGHPSYNQAIQPWPYDLEKAREFLEEAGWKDTDGDGIRDKDGKKFDFQLLLPSGRPIYTDLAVTVKGELAKIGVKMNIRGLDWASFISELEKRNFDAVTLGWAMGLDPDPYQLWHSSQAGVTGSNFIYFRNAEADRIIENARREFDDDKRNALFHRFHEIMHHEQPYTFLYNRPSLMLVHRRFENVRKYELGFEDSEWWVRPENQKYGVSY